MTSTPIIISNCNNIDSAVVHISTNKLNIKFGSNGTGKSTIATAIKNSLTEGSNLDELLPFKYRENNPDKITPALSGLEPFGSLMCFNEDYVSQFVFKPGELLQNPH